MTQVQVSKRITVIIKGVKKDVYLKMNGVALNISILILTNNLMIIKSNQDKI